MIGRPRKFDREEALDKAIRLFWEQGYEATGIAQISATLGIGRQSLYGTFGDKRTLFIEALNLYADRRVNWLRATLTSPGRAVDQIERVMESWVSSAHEEPCVGCFIANTMSELGARDPEIAQLLSQNLTRMSAAFELAIESAKKQGDLKDSLDSGAFAKTLVNTAQGLSAAGKVDADFAEAVVGQVRLLLH